MKLKREHRKDANWTYRLLACFFPSCLRTRAREEETTTSQIPKSSEITFLGDLLLPVSPIEAAVSEPKKGVAPFACSSAIEKGCSQNQSQSGRSSIVTLENVVVGEIHHSPGEKSESLKSSERPLTPYPTRKTPMFITPPEILLPPSTAFEPPPPDQLLDKTITQPEILFGPSTLIFESPPREKLVEERKMSQWNISPVGVQGDRSFFTPACLEKPKKVGPEFTDGLQFNLMFSNVNDRTFVISPTATSNENSNVPDSKDEKFFLPTVSFNVSEQLHITPQKPLLVECICDQRLNTIMEGEENSLVYTFEASPVPMRKSRRPCATCSAVGFLDCQEAFVPRHQLLRTAVKFTSVA